jgi:hypothetical protein
MSDNQSTEERILKSDIDTVGGACVSYGAESDFVIPIYLQSVLVLFILVVCILLRYVYLSNVYLRSQLTIYWCHFI